ncbi:hypothetical protein GCM10022224_049740 [Nonomuraea antimicrobica]|uniref:PASTA domain-containing protein n=1 Tax=Nonomuraea antimicrobica TaxID=561173 RepID=A0ABP7C710_9ACTN
MHDLDRLVAGIAPDPGPGLTPLAGDLLEEITALPVPPPRAARRRWFAVPRPRRWAAVPVLALLTALLSFGVAQAPASAALDIERDGDHYVITVKDLMAEPNVYERELRARGLDITLRLWPTSASLTGQMFVLNDMDRLRAGKPVPAEGPITTIDSPQPCPRWGGCPIGLRVPVDFARRAEVVLGRRAAPGEQYQMPPGVAMPGEPLYCVDFVNRSVAEVTTMLRERDVRASYTSAGQDLRWSAPDDWRVHDGVMSADGLALLLIGPEPTTTERPPDRTC